MKIRLSTWIVLLLAVIVVGGYLGWNHYQSTKPAPTPAAPAPATLFPASVGAPTEIKIVDATGQTVDLARNSSGNWVLNAPTAAPADPSQAEAAASQLTSLSVVGNVQIGLDVVGLDKPSDTLTVTFADGKVHKLTVGSQTPIQTGYYVQLDGGRVQVVEKSGLDALLGMLSAPPYVPTATPAESATPSAAPSATAAPSSTPAAASAGGTPAGTTATAAASATP